MANNKKRRPTPYSKSGVKSPIPMMHVRLSAEYWLDVFTERLMQLVNDDDETHKYPLAVAVDEAHALADAALEAYERRWPGVKQLP